MNRAELTEKAILFCLSRNWNEPQECGKDIADFCMPLLAAERTAERDAMLAYGAEREAWGYKAGFRAVRIVPGETINDAHARGAREALEKLEADLPHAPHSASVNAIRALIGEHKAAMRRPAAEGDGDAPASPSLERASSADLAGDVFERVAAEWHDIPYKQKILAALLRERFGPVVEALETIRAGNSSWQTHVDAARAASTRLAGQPAGEKTT